jgi:DNA primase
MTDLNIVDVIGRRVVLEKMGDVYWGICPFHVSKEEIESKFLIAPTMIVNKEESSFRCHKCDASGGPEDFLEMYEENQI